MNLDEFTCVVCKDTQVVVQCDPCEKWICFKHFQPVTIESESGDYYDYIFCLKCIED